MDSLPGGLAYGRLERLSLVSGEELVNVDHILRINLIRQRIVASEDTDVAVIY
jgi:hypothetical protein